MAKFSVELQLCYQKECIYSMYQILFSTTISFNADKFIQYEFRGICSSVECHMTDTWCMYDALFYIHLSDVSCCLVTWELGSTVLGKI